MSLEFKEDEKLYEKYNDYETLIEKILCHADESDFKKFENVIFKDTSDVKKVGIEYNRIKSYLEKHEGDKVRYFEELNELQSNYRAYLQLKSKFALETIRKKIVGFDILFGINIGLYESLVDGYKYYFDNLKKYKHKDYESEESFRWKKKR